MIEDRTSQAIHREEVHAPEVRSSIDRRWDLAFLGILGYIVIEYTRLPAMFPILMPLQLGKVVIALSIVGMVLSPRNPFTARLSGAGSSPTTKLDMLMAAFVMAAVVCSISAEFPDATVDSLITILQWAVIYYLLGRVVITPWRLRVFLFVLLLLNLKLAQFSIRQYFSGLAYWGNAATMAKFGAGGGSTGFFGNAGDFGVAMAVIWPLSAMLLFARMKKSWRLMLLITNATILGAVIFCGSRGALVGAGLAVLGAWLRNPKRIAGPALALVLVASIIYVLPDANKDRFRKAMSPEKDETATIRLTLWKAGLQMFEDHPVFGVGLGNFPAVYRRSYVNSSIQQAEWAPHSIYIQALSELGLFGAVPMLALWLMLLYVNFRTRKNLRVAGYPERSLEYCLSVGIDLGLLGFLGSGAFLTVLYYPHLWILLGLTVGLHTASRAILAQKAMGNSFEPAPEQELNSCSV